MGWMQLVTSLASTVAWPVVVIVAVLVFRQPIGSLLPKLQSVDIPGVGKLTFKQAALLAKKKADAIKKKADAQPAKVDVARTIVATPLLLNVSALKWDDVLSDTVRLSLTTLAPGSTGPNFNADPYDLVENAWKSIEKEMDRISAPGTVSLDVPLKIGRLVHVGTIDTDEADLLSTLYRLSYQALADPTQQPDKAGVASYLDAAQATVDVLKNVPGGTV